MVLILCLLFIFSFLEFSHSACYSIEPRSGSDSTDCGNENNNGFRTGKILETAYPVNMPCDIPVLRKGDKIFHVSTFKSTYLEARAFCCKHNMQLVSILNETENNVIHDLIVHHTGIEILWTSGNRMVDGSTWAWSNGTPLEYTKWDVGEPNNKRGNEYCLEVFNRHLTTWNDDPCDFKNHFICERRLN